MFAVADGEEVEVGVRGGETEVLLAVLLAAAPGVVVSFLADKEESEEVQEVTEEEEEEEAFVIVLALVSVFFRLVEVVLMVVQPLVAVALEPVPDKVVRLAAGAVGADDPAAAMLDDDDLDEVLLKKPRTIFGIFDRAGLGHGLGERLIRPKAIWILFSF